MYALAIVRYRKSLEEVLKHIDSHRAYLQGLKQEGLLLVSGPLVPRTAQRKRAAAAHTRR